MKARDVMVAPVITVKPYCTVKEIAKTLVDRRISAVPVVDDAGKLVGIISEGDLMHRAETGTDRRYRWRIRLVEGDASLSTDYIKAYARKAADIMTENVITAAPETSLDEIAIMLEKNSIKRVPIVRDGQLVGIVSRANCSSTRDPAKGAGNSSIGLEDSRKLLSHLKEQSRADTHLLNVTVTDGVVNLWGITSSETERRAIRVAAEATPGVRAVNDHLARGALGHGL
jgi:CBS domain-containing protein